MESLLLFCVLVGAPFFGLGYYRSWKVAGAVILVVAAISGFYAYGLATAAPDDPAANEWGAQAAPAFFGWMAVVLAVAFALGVGTRLAVDRKRSLVKPRDGDVSK